MKRILFLLIPLYFLISSSTFSQWNDLSDPAYESPYCIEWADSLNAWIGRDDNALRSTDGGESWFTTNEAPRYLYDLYFLDSNIGWGITYGQHMYRTHDGGNSWWSTIVAPNYPDLNSIHFPSYDIGYIAGDEGRLFKSTNHGSNWFEPEQSLIQGDLGNVFFINDTVGWVTKKWHWSEIETDAKIIHTTDGGDTWTEQYIEPESDISSIYFHDRYTGFVTGTDGTIHKTTNGGAKWEIVHSLESQYSFNISLDFYDRNEGLGCTGGVIVRTSDGGDTWYEEPAPFGKSLRDFKYSGSSHKSGIAIGGNGTILQLLGSTPFAKVIFPNGGERLGHPSIIPVSYQQNNINNTVNIYYTTNSGVSWIQTEEEYISEDGLYNWEPPEINSSQCLIKITDVGGAVVDVSDSLFSISPDFNFSITLLEPRAGEQLIRNNDKLIRWDHHNVKTILMEFSQDNGVTWEIIDEDINADNDSYLWKIPDIVSEDCRIRISDASQLNIMNENAGAFSVINNPSEYYYQWRTLKKGSEVYSVVQNESDIYRILAWGEHDGTEGLHYYDMEADGTIFDAKQLSHSWIAINNHTNENYLVAGVEGSLGDMERDIIAGEIDIVGDTLWTQRYNIQDNDWPRYITQVTDGALICGYGNSSFGEYAKALVIKIDPAGDEMWQQFISVGENFGSWSEIIKAIETPEGDYMLLGNIVSQQVREGHTSYHNINDVFVAKVNFAGSILWVKTYKFDPVNDYNYMDERGSNIITIQNGYAISGIVKPWKDYYTSLNSEPFLITIDEDGGELIKHSYSVGNIETGNSSVSLDDSGNYLLTNLSKQFDNYYGSTPVTAHILRINNSGRIINTVSFNLEDDWFRVDVNGIFNNGDYLIMGSDRDNNISISKFAGEEITPVEEEIISELPRRFTLSQNYPNPFNPATVIKYSIPVAALSSSPSGVEGAVEGQVNNSNYSQLLDVTLKVYDVLGREVTVLVNDTKPAGTYRVEFDASGLSSGVYFYRLQSGAYVETKKMILLR